MERRSAATSTHEPTRRAILRVLKLSGPAQMKTIASECRLTTMAVHRHLLHLKADGLVQTRTERRPQGRPVSLFYLSELGDAQFPRDYGAVARELLETIRELDGDHKLLEVFARRREALGERFAGRVTGKPFEDRVQETAAILTECGYMAGARAAAPGCMVLTEHNCAIRDVAICFPEACHQELVLIGDLTGAKVKRVAHLLNGDHYCAYEVRSAPAAPARSRRKRALSPA